MPTTHFCQICHATPKPSVKIYLLNKVSLCLSCRRVFYLLWREICEISILDLIQHRNSPPEISKIILNCLNSEAIKNHCLQFLDFFSTENYTRCQILLSENMKPYGKRKNSREITDPGDTNKSNYKKYARICRLCRFRQMILTIRVIPKSKLVLKLDKYSDSEINVLKKFAAGTQPLSIFLGEQLPEIYSNSNSIFLHLEQQIQEIESKGGYSDLVAKSSRSSPSTESTSDDSDEVTSCLQLETSKIHNFYDFQHGISRFKETYNINVALSDMFRIFQVYSKIIELDIAKIEKQEQDLVSLKSSSQPTELIPLSIKNSLIDSNLKPGERSVQITDMRLVALKELRMYSQNLEPVKHGKVEDSSLDPLFENFAELKETLSTEIEQLVQNIKNRHCNTSKSQIIQEILEYLKTDSKFTGNNLSETSNRSSMSRDQPQADGNNSTCQNQTTKAGSKNNCVLDFSFDLVSSSHTSNRQPRSDQCQKFLSDSRTYDKIVHNIVSEFRIIMNHFNQVNKMGPLIQPLRERI